MQMWKLYLEAIELSVAAPRTSNSWVDGAWNISQGHLEYVKRHFCGGQVPLANGDCT